MLFPYLCQMRNRSKIVAEALVNQCILISAYQILEEIVVVTEVWDNQVQITEPFVNYPTNANFWSWNCNTSRCLSSYVHDHAFYIVTRVNKTHKANVAPTADLLWVNSERFIDATVLENKRIDYLDDLFRKINESIPNKNFFDYYPIAYFVRKYGGWHDRPQLFFFGVSGATEYGFDTIPCWRRYSLFYNASWSTDAPEHFELTFFV
uniref:Uncharacterized protein n=1 Tax=Ditylenchus dipsaci TaxID=166011 RepID=A0A915DXJ0_9BILA